VFDSSLFEHRCRGGEPKDATWQNLFNTGSSVYNSAQGQSEQQSLAHEAISCGGTPRVGRYIDLSVKFIRLVPLTSSSTLGYIMYCIQPPLHIQHISTKQIDYFDRATHIFNTTALGQITKEHLL
jgi:sorbitol-specific phosphotransferase system component IIBC